MIKSLSCLTHVGSGEVAVISSFLELFHCRLLPFADRRDWEALLRLEVLAKGDTDIATAVKVACVPIWWSYILAQRIMCSDFVLKVRGCGSASTL